jgi:xanthine dehydrogenase molybdopterin-binding subunit B
MFLKPISVFCVLGELYVAVVGSSKGHARILSVDPSAALAVSGVVGYLDHKSVPGLNRIDSIDWPELFAVSEVCHSNACIYDTSLNDKQVHHAGSGIASL